MNWQDKGYLLSKNKYNENSVISEFYTENHGKISGIIFGGTSKKIKNYLFEGNKLHINYNSKSQSKILSHIEHLLNENEIDLIRRARNKVRRYPKSSDPIIYSRATGFETLIGWLFLKDPQRLSTLFEYLELKMN